MATFTVTVPDAAVPRIKAAVAAVRRIPAPVTLADVQDALIAYLRDLCIRAEADAQQTSVPATAETTVAAVFPIVKT